MAEVFCKQITYKDLKYNIYWDEPDGEVRVAKVDIEGREVTSDGKYLENVKAESREHALEQAKTIIDNWKI